MHFYKVLNSIVAEYQRGYSATNEVIFKYSATIGKFVDIQLALEKQSFQTILSDFFM